MPEHSRPQGPPTLLETIFSAIDAVARRLANFMPLGRGIRGAMRSGGEELISWDHVREIAMAALELQRDKPPAISQETVDGYQVMLRDAKVQVAEYTGLVATGLPGEVEVFTQQAWIDANIASFRFLFDPISKKYVDLLAELEQEQAAAAGRSARRVARTVLSVQVGIIMGYMARNVLGQFDLSIPEPERGGRLYVVESNVRRVEVETRVDPTEFRQWITLHEVTHSFEFHCNGWLREYMSSSMKEYLDTIDWRGLSAPDLLRKMRKSRADIPDDDALRAGGLISIIATPEQRAVLGRLQAMMSVLEGYSNHVMDQVGMKLLPGYETMKERFERRRESKSGAERLFQRLIGISLKLQQYKVGQAFVDAVVEQEGLAFLNRVWEKSENMPSLDEVNNPAIWIDRMKGIIRNFPGPGVRS
jgi:coenzyme F420 biosynthesis associated uncharacterized protein